MRKYILLIILIWFALLEIPYANDFIYTEYNLELSNEQGVPYFYSNAMEDYCLWGFDIDDFNDLYFFGGDTATLVKVSINGKNIIRKIVSDIYPGAIGVHDGKLFFFDTTDNILYSYSSTTLKPLGKNKIKLKNHVNSYALTKEGIIFETVQVTTPFDVNKLFKYIFYSYDGESTKEVNSKHNLPFVFKDIEYHHYLGLYKEYRVFEKYNHTTKKNIFWLVDSLGKVRKKIAIDETLLYETFFEAPEQHWKRKGDYIYILGRNKKRAMIQKLDLKSLFK